MGIENSATKHHKLGCTDSAGVGISLPQWKICVSVQKALHTVLVVVSFHVQVLLFTYVYCDKCCNGFSVLLSQGYCMRCFVSGLAGKQLFVSGKAPEKSRYTARLQFTQEGDFPKDPDVVLE